ncbi:MAG: hypothetical protein GY696_09870 [Gammaproteobacteria bacterium]|nr:hypothetical protein [Gammaproteobacteria bacterium]
MTNIQSEQIVKSKQRIGPGKDKKDKLGQAAEWARIPKLDLDKTIVTPQASEKGVTLPPLSVNPMISPPIRNRRKAKGPASGNQEINISTHEGMHSQPAVLPPEIIHPDARTQAPPPYPRGRGCPHPLPCHQRGEKKTRG